MSRESPDPRDWTFSVGPRKGQKMIVEDLETKCWIWQGNTWGGYGVTVYNRRTHPDIRIGRKHRNNGGNWSAIMPHQLFYYLRYGNPPKNTELGHTCQRRSCCNPDHVRPITQLQNIAEMYRMPALSAIDRAWIEEQLLDDKPSTWIADQFNISVWSVRKIASQLAQRDQLLLIDPEVPF